MTTYATMYDFISIICDVIEMRMNRKYGSTPILKIDEGKPEFDFGSKKQPPFVVYVSQTYHNVPMRIVELSEDCRAKILQNPQTFNLSDIQERTEFLSQIEGIV